MDETRVRRSKEQGFTLIELLTVIAIIGILASIAVASLGGARARARDGEKITEVGQIMLAAELYRDACGQYPPSLSEVAATGCPSGVSFGTFLPGSSLPKQPNGTDYLYSAYSSGSEVVVGAPLEQANQALTDDLDGIIGGVTCTDNTYCKGS